MSACDKVLDRLAGVKHSGEGKWIARCPSHEDKSPSLSIREMPDGRVLLHCFAGCGAGDVLISIGLRMSDLFDKPIAHHLPPVSRGWNSRELLELSAHEACVAAMLSTKAGDEGLTPEEAQRLRRASARLSKAWDLSNGR
jgi:hypothetical protein